MPFAFELYDNWQSVYWAEWKLDNDILTIACFGWLLVNNHYEGHLYETARMVMQAIVRGDLDSKYQMFRFAGKHGAWTAIYVNPENPDDKLFVSGDKFELTSQ